MRNLNNLLNELVNDIDSQISSSLNKTELDRLARITGFNQRCGRAKITGSLFLDLLIFNADKLSNRTLEDCCEVMMYRHGLSITRQSLHERFNANAVFFLKSVLETLLRRKFTFPPDPDKIKKYRRVLIKDSTCFQLPETMKEAYPGSGGKGSGAAVRIQFEYDILSGSLLDLNITAFNRQDATDSIETADHISEGDLVIRDIAYMHKRALTMITDKNASYISRLDNRISVHELRNDRYERVDFSSIYKEMRKKRKSVMETFVALGADLSHCSRLIIYMIPENIQEQRLRKIRYERKRNGSGEPTKELKDRSRLVLIITNDLEISAEHLYSLYMLRWQIELVFKTWKSICGLASIKNVNVYRVECYIIGKVILILLAWKIIRPLITHVFVTRGVTISYYKAMKSLIHRTAELARILIFGYPQLRKFISAYLKSIVRNCVLDVKKGDESCFNTIISKLNLKPSKLKC
jgi:hypothetical protein